MKPTDIESITAAQFKLADSDGDGCISYEEFVAYYGLLAISRARQELRTALGPQAESELLPEHHGYSHAGWQPGNDSKCQCQPSSAKLIVCPP